MRLRRAVENGYWVLNLVALTVAAYLVAATVTDHVGDALFDPGIGSSPAPRAPRGASVRSPGDPGAGDHDKVSVSEELAARRVFDADERAPVVVVPLGTPALPPVAGGDEGLEDTALDIALFGTVVARDAGQSLATVRWRGAGRLVRVGSTLSDGVEVAARVVSIHPRHIVVLEGRTEKRVRLWDTEVAGGAGVPQAPRATTRPQPAPPARPSRFEQSVRQIAPFEYEVDRAVIEEEPGNLASRPYGGRIVPNVRDGRTDGFKVLSVRSQSLMQALGIQSGDVIRRVNGQSLDDPRKVLLLLEELRTAKAIRLDVERRGQDQTLVYHMR